MGVRREMGVRQVQEGNGSETGPGGEWEWDRSRREMGVRQVQEGNGSETGPGREWE